MFLAIAYANATEQIKQITLKDAIFIALRHNPYVRNAQLQRVIDKFGLVVAKNSYELRYTLAGGAQYTEQTAEGTPSNSRSASLTPGVNLLTSSGAKVGVNWNNTAGRDYYNPGLSLSVTQPLLQGYGQAITLSPLATAYDQEKINQLTLKKTVISTITTIIGDYLKIVQDQNSVTTQELALQTTVKEFEQNKIRIKAGKMAAADNIQQAASIADQRLSLIQAQNAFKQDKLALLNDMGLDPKTEFTTTKNISLPDEVIPKLTRSKKLILQNDIDYQSNLISLGIQERNLMVSKDKLRWKLDVTASAGVGNGTMGGGNFIAPSILDGQNNVKNIKLDLAIPIDDKQAQQAVVNGRVALQQANNLLEHQRYTLEANTINNLRNLSVQKQQIQQAIVARDLAQKSLDIAQKKLQYGLISTFETTSLRSKLINAQLQVLNSQISYLNALAALQQMLGITLDVWGINIRY